MLDLTREQLITLQNSLGLALYHSPHDEVRIRELLSMVTKAILETYSSESQELAKEKVVEITSQDDQFGNY